MKLLLTIVSLLIVQSPHWTLQTSGVNARLRGISAVSDRVAWASGSGSTVLRTSDGGATWQKLDVTTEQLDFRDIDAVDARIAYVLSIGNGPASRIYKTTDAGATWTLQFKNEDPKAFYDAMSFWDANHGIAIGDSIAGQFCIMTTENGGRVWRRVPASALPPALENEGAFAASGTNIAVFGKSHAWIGTGAAAKARVLRTNDRGRTWSVAETPLIAGPSAGIFSVAFRDAQHGVVVGGDYKKENEADDNLAMTNDGGATWTLVKGLSGFRSAVAYLPLSTRADRGPRSGSPRGVVVATRSSLRSNSRALITVGPSGTDYSTDDGHNWIRIDGPAFDTFSLASALVKGRPAVWGAGARGSVGILTF
jgi:photosystem II stability/assembly factor-like uncharacterized protein